MALIYNGTTIPSTATIKYNGTNLTKIIYNGVTVWQKNIYIIKAGEVIDSSAIVSATWLGSWNHTYHSSVAWEKTAVGSFYVYGYSIGGSWHQPTSDGGTNHCGYTVNATGVIKFSSAVAGKKVRLRVVADYSSRYFGMDECSVKNGNTVLENNKYFQNPDTTDLSKFTYEKTFTLDSSGQLAFKVIFTCANAGWGPSIRFGIYDLEIVE